MKAGLTLRSKNSNRDKYVIWSCSSRWFSVWRRIKL